MYKFTSQDFNKIKKVINSDVLGSRFGNVTRKFEREFAKKYKTKYVIAMNSGTSTLHSAIVACGVENGDEVIIPAIGVVCVANAVIHAKCVPVFADIDKHTFNIDPKDIERKITEKTKVIIAVSMFGLSPDMDEIMEIAKKHKLKVIEDAALSLLSYYKNKLVGTIGDFGSFSFEDTKHLPLGDGGMLITNNKKFAIKSRQVSEHGYKFMNEYGRIKNKPPIFENIGWNYRMTEISSAIGLIKLKKLDKLVENRINCAKMYANIIKNNSLFEPQFVPEYCRSSYYKYGVVFKGSNKEKNKFFEMMDFVSLWFRPIYMEPAIKKSGIINIKCPIASEIGDSIMVFKTSFNTEEEKVMVMEQLKKVLS